MGSEMYLDALPYIDQGYEEPGIREAVSSMYYKIKSNALLNNAHHKHLVKLGYAARRRGD